MLRQVVDIPIIAAGGIASGNAIYAALALGADGVQIGSLFASSVESSAHENFKKAIITAEDGSTKLTLKKVVPVRLIKNEFFHSVEEAENRGASREELISLLGRARAKLGMFEGNTSDGELEIGQVSSMITEEKAISQIFRDLISEYRQTDKIMLEKSKLF
ncbi:MAG: nitronate monooxygenase, partial [Marinilabiliales bacterium]